VPPLEDRDKRIEPLAGCYRPRLVQLSAHREAGTVREDTDQLSRAAQRRDACREEASAVLGGAGRN